MEGVEGVFLMLPPFFAPAPGFPEAKAILASFVEALRRMPPPRLVALSSVGAQQTSGLRHITVAHLLEGALSDQPCPTAFVRPGSFLENYAHALERACSTGLFDSLWTPTDRAFPTVATVDIGAEVARLLVGNWSGKRFVERGTRRSPDDLARGMSEALGRPVQARAVPREQWTATLEAQGLPRRASAPFEEMVDSYNSGWIDFGVPGTEPVPATTTPAQVFAQTMRAQKSSKTLS